MAEDIIIIQEIGIIEEPAAKRARLMEAIDTYIANLVESITPLKAILAEDYDKPMPVAKVYVAQVTKVSEMSKIILRLNEKFPLKDLSHLKRACRKEVLLFPTSYLPEESHESVCKFIDENLSDLKDSFEYYKIISVPASAPKTKKQFTDWGKSWSVNFHVDKYLEVLISGDIFSQKENRYHRFYMGMAFEIARFYLSKTKNHLEPCDIVSTDINASVVVDPFNKSVVAVAFDNRAIHPIQHTAMLAIDNVAKTQKGGVWTDGTDMYSDHLKGIGVMELLLHLQNKYPTIKFGAREYVGKSALNEEEAVKNLNDASKYFQSSPYLCTGYYVYMIREPCLMCAMALVHARSKRVFFAIKNDVGALGSKAKLQSVSSLNHHFEVFTGFF